MNEIVNLLYASLRVIKIFVLGVYAGWATRKLRNKVFSTKFSLYCFDHGMAIKAAKSIVPLPGIMEKNQAEVPHRDQKTDLFISYFIPCEAQINFFDCSITFESQIQKVNRSAGL